MKRAYALLWVDRTIYCSGMTVLMSMYFSVDAFLSPSYPYREINVKLFIMTVKEFILQNRERWDRLESLVGARKRSFEEVRELGRLYQHVTEDLSFAQTAFPDEKVTDYLNQVIRRCHALFFRQEKMRGRRIIDFFTVTFPGLLGKLWAPVLVSVSVFAVSIAVSFFMVKGNVEMGEIFLPETMYDMAVQDLELRKKFSNFDNIPKPMRTAISIYIWFNNSMVSLYCFVLGITFGIGTLYILIRNGFILGALGAVYYMNGHFTDFVSLIMVHGSIELVAIAFAGGAGLHTGLALISPGRLPRTQRLKLNAVHALKILWGVISLLLVAGLIEGLVTPLKLPVHFRFAVMSANLLLLGLYFLWGLALRRTDTSLQPDGLYRPG